MPAVRRKPQYNAQVPAGYISTRAAAELLGTTTTYIRQLARSGRVRDFKLNPRQGFVRRRDLLSHIIRRPGPGAPRRGFKPH